MCRRVGIEKDLSYLHHLHRLTSYIDGLVVGGEELPGGSCIGRFLFDADVIARVKEIYELKDLSTVITKVRPWNFKRYFLVDCFLLIFL